MPDDSQNVKEIVKKPKETQTIFLFLISLLKGNARTERLSGAKAYPTYDEELASRP